MLPQTKTGIGFSFSSCSLTQHRREWARPVESENIGVVCRAVSPAACGASQLTDHGFRGADGARLLGAAKRARQATSCENTHTHTFVRLRLNSTAKERVVLAAVGQPKEECSELDL